MTPEEKLAKIQELVDRIYREDFDFEVEHWDNGNYDDSYQYGYDCGEQDTIGNIMMILEKE